MMSLRNVLTNPTVTHLGAALSGFALSWLRAFLKHVPPPRESSLWAGAAFDALQDTEQNHERIGQRRPSTQ